MRFSASMLGKWMTCPLQAKFHYIDKIPSRKSSAMVFGTIVHLALEHYRHHKDVDKAIDMFKTAWDDPDQVGEKIEYWNKRTSAGSYREKGIEIIRNFHEKSQIESRKLLATEHGFKVPIGEHELVGYVDLLEAVRSNNGGHLLRIVDLKTGSKQPFYDALRNNIQFTIYDYASRQPEFWLGYPGDEEFVGLPNGGELWDKYRDAKRMGVWWHLSGDKEINVGERDQKDFERLYRVIDEVARAIEHEVFVPNISGDSCTFCDHTVECGVTIPSSEGRMNDIEYF